MRERRSSGDFVLDRRRDPRLPLRIEVSYSLAGAVDTGTTENLTVHGFFLRSDTPAPLDTALEFVLDLPDDDEQRAYHNIALIKTQIKMNEFGPSPNINFREVMKQQYNQLYTAGQTPYYTIFDPMRWAKFFDALKRGDFKQDD